MLVTPNGNDLRRMGWIGDMRCAEVLYYYSMRQIHMEEVLRGYIVTVAARMRLQCRCNADLFIIAVGLNERSIETRLHVFRILAKLKPSAAAIHTQCYSTDFCPPIFSTLHNVKAECFVVYYSAPLKRYNDGAVLEMTLLMMRPLYSRPNRIINVLLLIIHHARFY